MLRIGRYFMVHKLTVALIICLLVVQAFCDLALPHYLSDIVDIGIAQHGIEHATPTEMSRPTYDKIISQLNADERKLLLNTYTFKNDKFSLKDSVSTSTIKELDGASVTL